MVVWQEMMVIDHEQLDENEIQVNNKVGVTTVDILKLDKADIAVAENIPDRIISIRIN